jgi:hypothetical protein
MMTEDKKERKRLSNAASRARKKQDEGKPLTDGEKAAIDSWEVMKMAAGRPKKADSPGEDKPAEKAPAETPKAKAKPPEKAKEPARAPRDIAGGIMNRPPPSAPPRVFTGSKKENWRDKWTVGTGREATCVELATLWKSGMLKMVTDIEEMEGKPIFDAEAIEKVIFPAAVLTVDKLLPEGFETTPEATAAFGTTVTVGHRYFLARSRKAEAAKAATVDRSVRKNIGDTKPASAEPPAKVEKKTSAPPPAQKKTFAAPPAQSKVKKEKRPDDGSPLV